AATLGRVILPRPPRSPWIPAVEARFNVYDPSELILVHEPLNRQEIAIPAAIVKGNQEHLFGGCQCNQLRDLIGSCRDRLVDNQIFSRIENLPCYVEVSAAWRCHHYKID